VRNLIFEQVPSTELRTKARELGMRTLREDGLRRWSPASRPSKKSCA
jgi:hypothetical protein